MHLNLPFKIEDAHANGHGASTTDVSDDELPAQVRSTYEAHGVPGYLAKSRDAWMLAAFTSFVVSLLVSVASVWFVANSEVAVVKIWTDDLGRAVRADVTETVPEPSEQVKRTVIGDVIHNLRTISTDPAAAEDMLWEAYAHLAGQAEKKMNTYFSEHDPRVLGYEKRREVEITSVLHVPDTENLYKVEWTETSAPISASGSLRSTMAEKAGWEAYVRIVQETPEDADVARRNPYGLYITSLDWAQTTLPSTDDE